MRVPLNWLKEYVDIPVPLDELVKRLSMAGLEVENIERIGELWDRDKVFVGQVVAVRQHPDADRLVLVTVDYGQAQPLEVVTGAPNLHVGDKGQKVVFATIGTRLIDGHSETLRYVTLKRSKIRGVNSEGMVCSEKELGISDEHTGNLILPDDAPVGMPFVDYWGDTVLDLELTPNLARCLSITGVAREVAALVGGGLKLPTPTMKATGESIEGQIEIQIKDPDLCARYSAALITGIKIGPSPQWMQRRLTLAGMRPINNIVDITNYVMLEWGQPLHAFDYHRLRPCEPGGIPTIIVRRAAEGEKMATLDGAERVFTHDMLLITDGGGPVAVAGVMGGQESEVTEQTEDILLESANFNNISIRQTTAALRLPSEAALRFGRGVDPQLTLTALRRAAELMRELAGGTVAQGLADVYATVPKTKVIDLKVSEVKRLLGVAMSPAEVACMLMSLGFTCQNMDTVVRVTVPSFRLDVSIPADLVEEIARLYGYDRLPTTLMVDELPTQHRNLDLEAEERVRDILVDCGLVETISYSMTNLESVAKLTPDKAMPDPATYLRVTNPLSREHEYLRRTLMNTTLETLANNLRFVERAAIFEIAHVYWPQEGQTLPAEPRYLSIALTGPREGRSWLTNESGKLDFYDLKGIVEALCTRLGITEADFAPTQHPTFHPGRIASLSVGGEQIGVLGEIHPLVRANCGLPEQCVCLLEFNLDKLLAAAKPVQRYQEVSRMPTLKEDLALVVDEDVPADKLAAVIRAAGGTLLVDVVLFDVYRGAQTGAGKKSLAYSLTFQSPDKTLTSEQAARQRERIVQQLSKEFGAEIRA
jgi:phenylalanyl-tRNA synthetase beta chain